MAEEQHGQEAPPTNDPNETKAPETGSSDSWLDALTADQRDYIKGLRDENAKMRIRARDAQGALDKIQQERQQAEEAELAEQQKWQELAERREREANDYKAQLETERVNNRKAQIALEFQLPPALAVRLQGATDEEIRNDAQALAALIQPKAPAEGEKQQPPARSQTTSPVPDGQRPSETDEQRRQRLHRHFQSPAIFDSADIIVHKD